MNGAGYDERVLISLMWPTFWLVVAMILIGNFSQYAANCLKQKFCKTKSSTENDGREEVASFYLKLDEKTKAAAEASFHPSAADPNGIVRASYGTSAQLLAQVLVPETSSDDMLNEQITKIAKKVIVEELQKMVDDAKEIVKMVPYSGEFRRKNPSDSDRCESCDGTGLHNGWQDCEGKTPMCKNCGGSGVVDAKEPIKPGDYVRQTEHGLVHCSKDDEGAMLLMRARHKVKEFGVSEESLEPVETMPVIDDLIVHCHRPDYVVRVAGVRPALAHFNERWSATFQENGVITGVTCTFDDNRGWRIINRTISKDYAPKKKS
jgi:hypothetical protein